MEKGTYKQNVPITACGIRYMLVGLCSETGENVTAAPPPSRKRAARL